MSHRAASHSSLGCNHHRLRDTDDVLAPPPDLEVQVLHIGGDEYALLTYRTDAAKRPDGHGRSLHAVGSAAALTPAERRIAALAVRGHSNAKIARERGTSPRTVAYQLGGVYKKLGVSSRRELRVLFAAASHGRPTTRS